MARISKPPEVRRKEILDTAMRLFTEKGYEETSMADIARELGVVQGLCYRYFDSKQKLFREAMDQYVEECCARMLPVIQNRGRTIAQRMEDMARLILEEGEHSRWQAFYHRTGNEGLHEELTLRICRSRTPCVAGELEEANARGEIAVEHPGLAASFLLHGEIGLLGEHELPMETRVAEILRCACLILGISR